jgi:hypothetical protein
MTKWFKKDIKTMCQAIASFWLVNRPLGDSMRDHNAALDEVRAYLQEHRPLVVCHGIAELGGIAQEREQKDLDFVEHLRIHPHVYGTSTPEMIERFSKSAAENHKTVMKAEALIAKIEAEGLPPEVLSFDPVRDAASLY